eukprot:TRINITY_DN18525_c1_g1_i1.p1 TRINITY_DN18525_c1_g1~~TRINITY_DN18525_c1_g1_i1.p1  ORF type:complete len:1091 (+),score=312.50 TRINITY_DN18525_c1_g1_i1:79-3351(+)
MLPIVGSPFEEEEPQAETASVGLEARSAAPVVGSPFEDEPQSHAPAVVGSPFENDDDVAEQQQQTQQQQRPSAAPKQGSSTAMNEQSIVGSPFAEAEAQEPQQQQEEKVPQPQSREEEEQREQTWAQEDQLQQQQRHQQRQQERRRQREQLLQQQMRQQEQLRKQHEEQRAAAVSEALGTATASSSAVGPGSSATPDLHIVGSPFQADMSIVGSPFDVADSAAAAATAADRQTKPVVGSPFEDDLEDDNASADGDPESGGGGAGERARIQAGSDVVKFDLRACAPYAVVFSVMQLRRKAGLPPVDSSVFLASDPSQLLTDETSNEPPAADADEEKEEPRGEETGAETTAARRKDVDLYIPRFPGGVAVLKAIVRYLEACAAEERAHAQSATEDAAAPSGGAGAATSSTVRSSTGALELDLTSENVCKYLEAASYLRSPRILREAMLSPAAKALPSRQVYIMLQRVLRCSATAIDVFSLCPPAALREAGIDCGQASTDKSSDSEGASLDAKPHEFIAKSQVVRAFSQAIQRLCARIDAVDFRLASSLAVGSPSASLEILRAYKLKVENMNRVNYALQSVTSTIRDSTAKLFFYNDEDTPSNTQVKQQQEWKAHHFALHVFRKHLIEATLYSKDPAVRAAAERAFDGQEVRGDSSDAELQGEALPLQGNADNDIPEALCDGVSCDTLTNLAGLVQYCEALQTPPVLAAAMLRALMLTHQTADAQSLFQTIFVRSRKAQSMVVAGELPADFLCAVKEHRSAAIVLRRLLARHELLERAALCSLLRDVLLAETQFVREKHCHDLVLKHAVCRELIVFCRMATRGIAHAADSKVVARSSTDTVVADDSDDLTLRCLGERLFATVFVLHGGFLPSVEEDRETKTGLNWTTADCPWDTGDLDLPLLQHAPLNEESLQLARRVLLRGLFRRQRAGVEDDVATTMRLWPLGRWRSCREVSLISEAFGFLSRSWKQLQVRRSETSREADGCPSKAAGLLEDTEALFKMFAELEFWRLPPQELLTPWVPPHLVACHIAAQCRLLDEHKRVLAEDNRQNLEEINRLKQMVVHLTAKLDAVDARSVHCTEKQAEVADALRSLR